MKKLTAGIFATLLAVVSADGAYAAIASKGYVDEQVGAVESTVSTINETVTNLGDTINNAETGLSKQVEDLQTTVASKADSSTVTALGGRVDTAEDEIDALQTAATTYATKTELAGKQDTIAGAQLEALNSGITADKVEAYDGYAAQISGKLDTATADEKYAVKSTEGVASTASTNAQKALTNIGTLSELTTEAKGNTVAAINEVASEAAAAQTTATAAQGAAGTAQAAAEAAQGDVDALGVRVGTAESDIDGIQGQLKNMATSETVAGLKTDVDGLKTSKLDKATYDSQVGTVSAGNMGTTATTVVTAIKEVAGEAEAAQSAASAADSKAQAAQTTANAALPKATYDTQVGTVSATNMGTTASTVVTAIKEVAGEASAAASAASEADTKAGQAQTAADAAQEAAEAAQATASAAIPAPTAACADSANKCVLVSSGAGNYSWEVIARGDAE